MKKIHAFLYRHFTWKNLIVSMILFITFIIVVLPYFQNLFLSRVGVSESPDTSFFYTSSDLYQIASNYGVEGRKLYITLRFTFDLIWPLVYGSFLVFSIGAFLKKTGEGHYMGMVYIPIIAVFFDYLENIFASIVMSSYPTELAIIGFLTPQLTLLKWGFLTVAFLLMVVFGLYYLFYKVTRRNRV